MATATCGLNLVWRNAVEFLKWPTFWILTTLLGFIVWSIYKLVNIKLRGNKAKRPDSSNPARLRNAPKNRDISQRTVDDSVLLDEWLDDEQES
jgi:hypothetical protein